MSFIDTSDMMAVFGILFIFIVLGVLLFIPSGSRSSKKKKRRSQETKDWQQISLKLERHIQALRKEITTLQNREKDLERNILIEKEKYNRLQDKLSQERGWQKKEESDAEKKGHEIVKLKKHIKVTEQNLSQEHGARLKNEREVKNLKHDLEQSVEAKRQVEIQLAKAKALAEDYRKEILELKESNRVLSKKHDDATWIAKSEYIKLEKQLKALQRELADLKSQVSREFR